MAKTTKMKTLFSEKAIKDLGNYVYRLVDPRNGETFYVGRGVGNRVFFHATGEFEKAKKNRTMAKVAVSDDDDGVVYEDDLGAKLSRIDEIKKAQLNVIHIIHRHGIPSSSVSEVEAALIDAFPGLTNSQGGQASTDRGPMHVLQIMDKYDLPEVEENPTDKLLLININSLKSMNADDPERQQIYKQVRFAWRLNKQKANKADYVLAVVRGVVVGAFVVDEKGWRIAIRDIFPDKPFDEPARSAFAGEVAPPEIWEKYVGKRGKRIVNPNMRHVQNPVRYWNM